MTPILSGQRWTLACLAFCLAEASGDLLRAQESLSLTTTFASLPQLPSIPSAVDHALEDARRIEQDRLSRMNFFQAIATNDKRAFCKMLNDGMNPDAEPPLPVPQEFQKRFSDDLLLY